jgi:hypothetical protein
LNLGAKPHRKLFFKPVPRFNPLKKGSRSPTRTMKKRMTPGEDIEMIVSPVKPRRKFQPLFNSESGYEASGASTPELSSTPQEIPSTPHEFLDLFITLRPLLKRNPLPIRDLNKTLKMLSSLEVIPDAAFLNKIENKKVSPPISSLHMTNFFQFLRDIRRSQEVVLPYIKSRKKDGLHLTDFCQKLEKWDGALV